MPATRKVLSDDALSVPYGLQVNISLPARLNVYHAETTCRKEFLEVVFFKLSGNVKVAVGTCEVAEGVGMKVEEGTWDFRPTHDGRGVKLRDAASLSFGMCPIHSW